MSTNESDNGMYHLEIPTPDVRAQDGRLTMVVALRGYADAGLAVGATAEHLLSNLDHRRIVSFHNDELIDYRSRRPAVTMIGDEVASIDDMGLSLEVMRDGSGKPFLLLSGPEPDFRWDAFSSAVADLAERFNVGRTVALYAAPMTVPHTRPMNIICHGTDRDVMERYRSWGQRVTVPGAASLRLELEISRRGGTTSGFTAQVPHYIAQSEYPNAVLALLQVLSDVGGLELPTEAIERESERVQEMLGEQVEETEEIGRLVHMLEQQHDEEERRRSMLESSPLIRPDGSMATADELGAEFEEFLAKNASAPRPGGADTDNAGSPRDAATDPVNELSDDAAGIADSAETAAADDADSTDDADSIDGTDRTVDTEPHAAADTSDQQQPESFARALGEHAVRRLPKKLRSWFRR
ncbi:PAC2 family protein [Corynebacterium sp. TAE3-ERU12]|uniref:PAC2 family protein n=1 Tax=Corynebacterium sp. TAE3-ERU12 TaxID=2849491 RepID=UPI001C4678C6|nr:PAC2 family protein [Corynebacterium sp. TAE3-ERU12]MBV7295310.1 PAC2 family protein [Corynebacterium sp. TAE3-ERU12]